MMMIVMCQKKWALFWRRGTGLVNFMHGRVVKLTSYDFFLLEQGHCEDFSPIIPFVF